MARVGGTDIAEQVGRLLACPRCHGQLTVTDATIRCQNCDFAGGIEQETALFLPREHHSWFDEQHENLATSNQSEGPREILYDQQVLALRQYLRPGSVVLDVGCGPELEYTPPTDVFVMGLDASWESIRRNHDVNLRIYGSATELPLPNQSLDAIVAFYAVHHFTGQTVDQNRKNVVAAFREFGRVLKPGGNLLVFDIAPRKLAWIAEQMIWNTAKQAIGTPLDMFFWSVEAYRSLGARTLPGSKFTAQEFRTPWHTSMPLSFSLPWLIVPRMASPLDYYLFRWQF